VELVVHATPVKDELLFEPRQGQIVIDLAYRAEGGETAHAAAARAAGCEVVDGLEVLVLQGAASFERWTGIPAPIDVMRAAIRS
jgi:shikimate dehydrogenase